MLSVVGQPLSSEGAAAVERIVLGAEVGRAFEFSGGEASDADSDGGFDKFNLVGARDGGDDGVDASEGELEGLLAAVVDDGDLIRLA